MEVMFVPSLSWPQWISKLWLSVVEYLSLDGQSASTRSKLVIVTEWITPSFVGGVETALSLKPVLGQQFAKPIE
jgi:hypothetical protein